MSRWGASPVAADRTRFRLWAPDRPEVTLEIDGGEAIAMTRADDGWFSAEAPVGAGARYRFRLDADLAVPDPASRAQARGVHGWSVVVDPHAYRWTTPEWRGRPWEEAVIEEVHAGVLGGFAGVAERLPSLAELGVTAIELMPVNAFGGTRNWGYDGVLPYAPAEAYGSPEDLKALVDRAHALGLMVFLDVVYNHFGPDGNYLGAYAGGFFHTDVHTPWGGAVAVDAEPVHRFFVDNARMWLEEYRIDGLRFDAVHAIGNPGFLDTMATELREAIGPDRQVHLVLENEENDADRLGAGRYDAQWNDDFHNVLHVLLTGETSAYYQDFADGPAERLARCLAEGFIYQGEGSPNHDGKPRGSKSGHLPTTAFVSFLQNHDQVGNRAMGERLTRLADPDKLRAATALLLLGPQIPLLFMGDSEGSEAPFLFFTDFHDELADAVREGRRKEFAKFAAFADPAARERIPDPNARSTFDQSRPEPGPDAAEWRALYRELLALRHTHIVPRLKGTTSLGAHAIGEAAVVARWRMGDGATLTIALNLADAPVCFPELAQPLFARGEPGAAASVAVWVEA
ncbi:malto-oligosyltrehalose trehalohydrolase [Sphingomonas desiccabilis]|uniref:Malto-oligosyltrehalose trehalohydrolase n=1 Tax=Sphingomonas desiccabilis TaxID=429134 RepID=A0A4Q2ISU9_9SPHN|nr:malto-oligosyltrehalose trehalohydrolase [Sphingomonas desiccabilis]MBB3911767.1 maltooligosyltrehalose trehalohydrolase [Sphingomonas desiccabilis]RXZ31510.1 malto-oligosyltrehalose trehalohydrolase [Sphingomonas desiccabilis]